MKKKTLIKWALALMTVWFALNVYDTILDIQIKQEILKGYE